jgi:hypothetical protein
MAFIIKVLMSALLIGAISEIANRNPTLGALVASLPLVSILAVIWLWRETQAPVLIASNLTATFWLVLPSLPMFLVIPMLLRSGMGFWSALVLGVLLTIALYGGGIWVARLIKGVPI